MFHVELFADYHAERYTVFTSQPMLPRVLSQLLSRTTFIGLSPDSTRETSDIPLGNGCVGKLRLVYTSVNHADQWLAHGSFRPEPPAKGRKKRPANVAIDFGPFIAHCRGTGQVNSLELKAITGWLATFAGTLAEYVALANAHAMRQDEHDMQFRLVQSTEEQLARARKGLVATAAAVAEVEAKPLPDLEALMGVQPEGDGWM